MVILLERHPHDSYMSGTGGIDQKYDIGDKHQLFILIVIPF
jgi:hypothetical protein